LKVLDSLEIAIYSFMKVTDVEKI